MGENGTMVMVVNKVSPSEQRSPDFSKGKGTGLREHSASYLLTYHVASA